MLENRKCPLQFSKQFSVFICSITEQIVELAEAMAEEGNLLLRVPFGSSNRSSADLPDALVECDVPIN